MQWSVLNIEVPNRPHFHSTLLGYRTKFSRKLLLAVTARLRSLRASVAKEKRHLWSLYETEWNLTNKKILSIHSVNVLMLTVRNVHLLFHWKSVLLRDTWCPRIIPWRMYFYVIDTYCLRIIPVYSSRLGGNCYGTNKYSPVFQVANLFQRCFFWIIYVLLGINHLLSK